MGGKNHQPHRSYLLNSTGMSRAMNLAFAHVELADGALEDVISTELNGIKGNSKPIISQLKMSLSHLKDTAESLSGLCQQMLHESFHVLPSLEKTNLANLGRFAEDKGIHPSSSDWAIAAETMHKQGFWGMISIFEKKIEEIDIMTQALIGKVSKCSQPTDSSGMLEENSNLDFKWEFAKLNTAWTSFQQVFLASSLISTELWCRSNGFGSLLQDQKFLRAAA